MHFTYLSTESTILPPGTQNFNIKGVLFLDKIPLPQVKYHLGILSNGFAVHY